jgi:hypothetical protein
MHAEHTCINTYMWLMLYKEWDVNKQMNWTELHPCIQHSELYLMYNAFEVIAGATFCLHYLAHRASKHNSKVYNRGVKYKCKGHSSIFVSCVSRNLNQCSFTISRRGCVAVVVGGSMFWSHYTGQNQGVKIFFW